MKRSIILLSIIIGLSGAILYPPLVKAQNNLKAHVSASALFGYMTGGSIGLWGYRSENLIYRYDISYVTFDRNGINKGALGFMFSLEFHILSKTTINPFIGAGIGLFIYNKGSNVAVCINPEGGVRFHFNNFGIKTSFSYLIEIPKIASRSINFNIGFDFAVSM